MIPLHKLARLPRSQRLRKIEKYLTEAEKSKDDTLYPLLPFLSEALFSLTANSAGDDIISGTSAKALGEAAQILRDYTQQPSSAVKRAISLARHILITETGRTLADWDFVGESGTLDEKKRHIFPGMEIYLEDIRSPFNVGAMFRTAESFAVDKIWISPLCADPTHARAMRSSMGCISIMPWERCSEPFSVDSDGTPGLLHPKNASTEKPIFALETGGTDIDHFTFPPQGIMIVGAEELGVSPEALAAADRSLGRVTISTYGAKGSLNVSVAFGIVMQKWAQALMDAAD